MAETYEQKENKNVNKIDFMLNETEIVKKERKKSIQYSMVNSVCCKYETIVCFYR